MAYDKKSWTEFRETGLFHFVNSFLHLFGWAIVLSEEDDGSTEVFPARTDYRGFPQESNDTAYSRVTEFLHKEFQSAPVEAKAKKGGSNEGLTNRRAQAHIRIRTSSNKESNSSEGAFTDTFRIQYLDEFDPEYSGKEVLIEGTGADRASARKDAIKKFYDEHPDADIHAIR